MAALVTPIIRSDYKLYPGMPVGKKALLKSRKRQAQAAGGRQRNVTVSDPSFSNRRVRTDSQMSGMSTRSAPDRSCHVIRAPKDSSQSHIHLAQQQIREKQRASPVRVPPMAGIPEEPENHSEKNIPAESHPNEKAKLSESGSSSPVHRFFQKLTCFQHPKKSFDGGSSSKDKKS